ncbi:MAG TPA: 23S rRNA (adenine(2503)-C(2))-methyltransferase RlmN [Candidatus Copromorpha excrementipullorum]|uniref:Probable dual-specificity RNA methyltransferase RlmN n=1 Tax=Candidatus Allocopromorpha excrementipullorum TaxID=2840743 RepID=A0A9D1N695_9FIRM|nr:23S rRNA (adenine(2503)-C(2))-methyltransferase RlmN [Candidatus Copromorpha excrementipullorum]
MEKVHLLGFTEDEMKSFAREMGEAAFRGRQIFRWIWRGARDFSQMTDLPAGLREKLDETACIGCLDVLDVQEDEKDGTRKFLFGLEDGNTVEGVFMKYRYGNSMCVSSQVGCKMGCKFCASALGGFVRDLTAGEISDQILSAERYTGEKVNHVVVMGMGEPLDNYDNLSQFLRLLHEQGGKNMSYRSMTVSTSGIVPAIAMFADDFPQVNLAVSLHRLTDSGRNSIMPVNRKYPVDELLLAADRYTEKTGRRVTFEYALIDGENDREEDVELMIRKLRGKLCHVNLIPLNEVKETGLTGSSRRRAEEIAAALNSAGIPATVRRELGSKIDGACGQLRRKAQEKQLPKI